MSFQNSFPYNTSEPLKSTLCCPFHSFINLIKHTASWFPLFAASQISDSARSALCSIPRPNAQQLASMTIASASPRATQSSRSATAFGWFCGTPFPSISRSASSLFASMSPCVTRTFSSSTLCAFTSFLSVISVLSRALILEREKEKKGEKSKRKEEKGEKSCFLFCVFGLLEWLLFFFSFLPNTLPFFLFLLFSLCVLPIHSCQQHHTHTGQEGMDTK